MVELDFEKIPPQIRFKLDFEKLAGNHHKMGKETEFDVTTRAFGSNEIDIAYIEGDPGQGFQWHNHDYNLYQAYIPLTGRVRVYAIDHDESEHHVDAEPGEMIYLPPGARNRVEAVGDERVKVIVVGKETKITRVDQVVKGDSDEVYNPHTDPEYGLEIDTLRGNVVQVNEDVVEEW